MKYERSFIKNKALELMPNLCEKDIDEWICDLLELFDYESCYFEKMMDLVFEDYSLSREIVHNRNVHHIVPKYFFKKKKIQINNKEVNLVSISIEKHFLVHYYGYLCANKGFSASAGYAVRFFTKGIQSGIFTDEDAISVGRMIECSRLKLPNPMKDPKIAEKMTSTKLIKYGNKSGPGIPEENKQDWIEKLKEIKHDEEWNNKVRETVLKSYIGEKGEKLKEKRKKEKEKQWKNPEFKKKVSKKISERAKEDYANGKREHVKKASAKATHERFENNDIYWIHNNAGESKMIPKQEAQKYLENGWQFGRAKMNKVKGQLGTAMNKYTYETKKLRTFEELPNDEWIRATPRKMTFGKGKNLLVTDLSTGECIGIPVDKNSIPFELFVLGRKDSKSIEVLKAYIAEYGIEQYKKNTFSYFLVLKKWQNLLGPGYNYV